MVLIVSACLAGINCRYDESAAKVSEKMKTVLKENDVVPVCPEAAAGLSIPRPRAEIAGGTGDDVLNGKARVISLDGDDLTESYLLGAHDTLEIAGGFRAKRAVLKSKSPSCGLCRIYDGSFTCRLRPGHGVTAALLIRSGIIVIDESGAGF